MFFEANINFVAQIGQMVAWGYKIRGSKMSSTSLCIGNVPDLLLLSLLSLLLSLWNLIIIIVVVERGSRCCFIRFRWRCNMLLSVFII